MKKMAWVCLGLLVMSAVLFPGSGLSLQTGPEEKTMEASSEPEGVLLVSSPRNIKEATGVYVFLAWMWLSIGALVYVIRLKIKEADRLDKMKFFHPGKKQSE